MKHFCVWFIVWCATIVPTLAQEEAAAKANFEKAAAIRSVAYKNYKKNQALAEKSYIEANEIYPGDQDGTLMDRRDLLPQLRFERGDLRGANQAAQTVLDRLGKMTQVYGFKGLSHRLVPSEEIKMQVLLYRADANMTYGDFGVARADIEKMIAIGIDEKNYKKLHWGFWTGMPGSIAPVLQNAQYIAFLYEDAQFIKKLQPVFEKTGDKDVFATGEIYDLVLSKNYDKALTLAEDLEKSGGTLGRINSRVIMAWIYALKNDPARSEEYVLKAKKNIFVGDSYVSRVRAVNALNQKEFDKAIGYAADAMKPAYRSNGRDILQPGRFFYYTLRAQAYTGLKQYENARADFEKALLYSEGYEPAVSGLANLESLLVKERQADKQGPQITITEPASARGLKVVAAGNDLTIRGIANDPSGIKEVKANGESMYVQPNGTFWGSIKLAEGNSKITVSATDAAGNSSDAIIEVEKKAIAQATDIVPVVKPESKNYALIIAAQNYNDSNIPSLENPIADAIKLKLVLRSGYNFADDHITTLFNPTVADLKKQFAELNDAIQPEDNLIIFYAGHGIWADKEKKGYWLLTDALRNDLNTWLPNKLVLDMIATIPARHTLLITDACFSGSVFKSRGLGNDAAPALREMDEKISRVAITSGNDTEVPDQSVFMKYLVKALSENKEKYLTAQKLFINQIIEPVMTETKTEPRYGTLELAGHIGGDFIFTKRQ